MAAAVNLDEAEVVFVAREGFFKRPNETNSVIRRMLTVVAEPVSSKSNQFRKQKNESRYGKNQVIYCSITKPNPPKNGAGSV